MRERILPVIIVICLYSFTLQAQDERGGIMIGASSETVSLNDIKAYPNEAKSKLISFIKGEGIVGGEFGGYGRFRIVEPLYIKPELLMLYANGTVLVKNANNTNTDAGYSYFKIEFPVLVEVHVAGTFSLEGGPVYNYNLSSNYDYEGQVIKVQPSGFGYRAGLEFKLGEHAIFDLCLQGQNNNSSISAASFNVPYCILGDLGILFGESHP